MISINSRITFVSYIWSTDPKVIVRTTISQTGTFFLASRNKPQNAIIQSSIDNKELVRTGSIKTARSKPTTAALTPEIDDFKDGLTLRICQ